MTAQNDVTNRSGCNSGKPPFSEAKNRGPVKLIDRGTGAAIILAAGNGVVLSTWGAHEMFQVGWTFAISFAAAVHILVSMSLWALPRSPLLRKVLLMLLWGIGST